MSPRSVSPPMPLRLWPHGCKLPTSSSSSYWSRFTTNESARRSHAFAAHSRILLVVRFDRRCRSDRCNKRSTGLQPLADDVLHQVADAVGVAPFVVVPAHELEEPLVELDARAFVKD